MTIERDLASVAERARPDSLTPPDLRPALSRLDLRLRLAVESFRGDLAERARDPFRGLYISESDVDELLAETPDAELAPRLLDGTLDTPRGPRFDRLARLFELTSFECEALLVCLAPDVDLRYERLYAYLQDDVTRRRPTVDLVLRLLDLSPEERVEGRAVLGPSGRMLQHGLLVVANADDAQTRNGSLLARPLRADERIVDFLLGSDRLDPSVALHARLLRADAASDWSPPAELATDITRLLLRSGLQDSDRGHACGPLVYLQGPAAAAKRAVAHAACAAAGLPLLLVDCAGLLDTTPEAQVPAALAALTREARLQGAVLCLDGFDRVLANDPEAVLDRSTLRQALAAHRGALVMLGETRWEPTAWLPGAYGLRLELHALSADERAALWRAQLDGILTPGAVSEVAARYRLVDDDAVQAVATDAISRAALRGEADAAADDVWAAARAIATPPLEGLARHLEPRYGWDDIVLPADGRQQLRELCARLRHRATVLEHWGYGRKHARRGGLTALFAGPPGTGKTMAAEIVAAELGLDLYRIDLSAVVSKYVGETEKNLERIFRAADQGDAVLLFDEADALFGKRSEVRDAHDRYANVEVAYLLQRLEAYDGLAVLTTNLRGNIDDAFIRRLDSVIEFPLPEEPERQQIWKRALPAEAPLGADTDLPFLARKFKLSGGHIRNIALTAAFLAAEDGEVIGMRHLARATRREYQKLGKLIAESDFAHTYAESEKR